MFTGIMKLLGGALGPYLMGAAAVVLAGALATATVQSLRLGNAKKDLKGARAALVDPDTGRKWKALAIERQTALTTCQTNRRLLQGELDGQNAAVGRWKAEATRRAADASQAALEARGARAVAESRARDLAALKSARSCPGREAAIAEIAKGLIR